jgi:hypothetical protein
VTLGPMRVGAYNPGMNPFAPMPSVRFETRWALGDPGAVYEFNVKIHGLPSNASEEQWDREVRRAFRAFETMLRARYPWLGELSFTGRSAGWLAIEDAEGRMTIETLNALSDAVDAALARFKQTMVRVYPRGGRRS